MDVWKSDAAKKTMSVNAIPAGVRKQIYKGTFKKCLPYEEGMAIPSRKADGTLLSASEQVYVCGKTGSFAYRVKNYVTAALYDPATYATLTTETQNVAGAYEITDKIASDPFNPNSGEFSETWTAKAGGYPLGKLVNIDNGVYKCLKPADCGKTDPGDDDKGTVW